MANNPKSTYLRDGGDQLISNPVVVIICLSAFTFSTLLSGYGIAISMTELGAHWIVRFVIAVAATALLTGLAFVFWRLFGTSLLRLFKGTQKTSSFFKAIVFVLLGLTVTSASILTSFSAAVFLLQEDAVQTELRAVQTAQVAGPINAFATSQLAVASLASSVESTAKAASNSERLNGGSCGPTRPGAGPITDLRALHSKQASAHAKAANSLGSAASTLYDDLLAAQAQADVNRIYREAQALFADPRRKRMTSWAAQTRDTLNGKPVSFQGAMRTCVDTDMAETLDALFIASNQVEPLPADIPQIRLGNVFDSMTLTFAKVGRLASGERSKANDWSVLPYLVFSVLLDAIGLVSAIVIAIKTSDRLTADERAGHVRTSWAIRHLVWPFDDGQTYLLVPIGGDPDKENLARNLVTKLGLTPRPVRFRIPMSVLRKDIPDLPAYFSGMTGRPSHVDMFQIDRMAEKRMHEMHNAAILSLEYDAQEYRDYPSYEHAQDEGPDLKLVG